MVQDISFILTIGKWRLAEDEQGKIVSAFVVWVDLFISVILYAPIFQGPVLMAIEAATMEDYESDNPVQHAQQVLGRDFVSTQVIFTLAEEYKWILPRW